MKTILSRVPELEYRGEALVVGVSKGESPTSARLKKLDVRTGGLLSRAMSGDDFSGQAGQTVLLYDPPGLEVGHLLLVAGIGA